MENLTIGYEFVFNLAIKKTNGKIFKSHVVVGLGLDYASALFDVHVKLKKKRSEIIKVNTVRTRRIAFAIREGKSIPLCLADYPPQIPEDLNLDMKYSPKKTEI